MSILTAISYNILGISEVPSKAKNLDGALAKLDIHLLGDASVTYFFSALSMVGIGDA